MGHGNHNKTWLSIRQTEATEPHSVPAHGVKIWSNKPARVTQINNIIHLISLNKFLIELKCFNSSFGGYKQEV